MSGTIWCNVVFRNPSAVSGDNHTIRLQASIGKTWRALFFYPITDDFTVRDAIDRFCKEFFEFYDQAQAA